MTQMNDKRLTVMLAVLLGLELLQLVEKIIEIVKG